MDFRKLRDAISETDATMHEIHLAIFEQRAEVLKRSVEDGSFKYILLGGTAAAAYTALIGRTYENETIEYIGYGGLLMSAVYGSIIYGPPLFRRKKREDKS